MLLGIALFKWGFFTGAWKKQAYFRMILVGYGLGFPLVIWNFYYGYVNYLSLEASLARMEVVSINWMDLIYPVQRILLMMAHASVVIVIVQLSWFRSLTDRLRAVGQMAFTNYIVHTLICTFFFFGYGLNYYAELSSIKSTMWF